MSNGSELKGHNAKALRAAGYVPLPRWWVTQDQLDAIGRMARGNEEEIARIREEADSMRVSLPAAPWEAGQ